MPIRRSENFASALLELVRDHAVRIRRAGPSRMMAYVTGNSTVEIRIDVNGAWVWYQAMQDRFRASEVKRVR